MIELSLVDQEAPNSCITLDLYRKRPGGQRWKSRMRRGPGRFGSSR